MAVGETTEHGEVLFEARAGLDRNDRLGMVGVALGCLLGVPYVFARNHEAEFAENLTILGLGFAVVVVVCVVVVAHLNGRFQVTGTHVVKQRLLRPALVVPRSEVAEAVVTREYAVPGASGPRAILLDRDGEALLTSQPLRELADVEALAAVAPHVTHLPVLRPQEAAARWPRMLPWSHRNPRAGVALGVGIVLAAVLVAVVAIVVLT